MRKEVPDRTSDPEQQQHGDTDQTPFYEAAASAGLAQIKSCSLVNITHRAKIAVSVTLSAPREPC